jgi:hypothetical protein
MPSPPVVLEYLRHATAIIERELPQSCAPSSSMYALSPRRHPFQEPAHALPTRAQYISELYPDPSSDTDPPTTADHDRLDIESSVARELCALRSVTRPTPQSLITPVHLDINCGWFPLFPSLVTCLTS